MGVDFAYNFICAFCRRIEGNRCVSTIGNAEGRIISLKFVSLLVLPGFVTQIDTKPADKRYGT